MAKGSIASAIAAVTVSLLINLSSDFVRSLAVTIALYLARKRRRPKGYKSKRELATAVLDKLAGWRGPSYRIVVVGDAYWPRLDRPATQ